MRKNHQEYLPEQRENQKGRRKFSMRTFAAIAAGAAVLTGSFMTGAIYSEHQSVQAAETLSLNKDTETAEFDPTPLSDYSALVDQCMPQLVAITNVIEVTSTQNGSIYDEFFWGFGSGRQSQGSSSAPQVEEQQAAGSGVIIGKTDSELLIVTNNHVAVHDEQGNSMFYSYVASTKELRVTFADGNEVVANLKGADADADIAVIAVNLADISGETMDVIDIATIGNSDNVKVGQGVMAIGNALGYGQTVTFGHISALNREVTTSADGVTRTLLQTDATINAGNSGGGLFNAKGQLIGINSAKSSGVGIEGMGYAIPITSVEELINTLMNEKTKVTLSEEERGYLGIQGVDVPANYVDYYGFPAGAYVTKITEGSPAEKSGLQMSDIITAVEGKKITSYEELRSQIGYYAAGETITITVSRPEGRGYQEIDLQVVLANRADIMEETQAEPSTEASSGRVELKKGE